MPNLYKVREQTASGDVILYHSSADIVMLDENKVHGLGDNLETAMKTLNDKAEGKANTTTLKATIKASAFTGGTSPYKQTISVKGILDTDNPIAGVLYDEDTEIALKQREAWGNVSRIKCNKDSITVYCYEDKPTTDVPIQLKVVR